MRFVRSRLSRRLILPLCAAFLAGGCSDDEKAGELLAVLSSAAILDGEPTAGGDPIPFGSVLATDGSGVADFVLGPGLLHCRLQPGGEIRIGQTADAPVDLVLGSLLCSSERSDADPPRLEVAKRVVEVGRGRLHVEVTNEEAVVRNAAGEVTVDDEALDAGQEVPIHPGTGVLGPPVPIPTGALPPDAAEVFSTLEHPSDSAPTVQPDESGTATPSIEPTDSPSPEESGTGTPTPDASDTPVPETTHSAGGD